MGIGDASCKEEWTFVQMARVRCHIDLVSTTTVVIVLLLRQQQRLLLLLLRLLFPL